MNFMRKAVSCCGASPEKQFNPVNRIEPNHDFPDSLITYASHSLHEAVQSSRRSRKDYFMGTEQYDLNFYFSVPDELSSERVKLVAFALRL